VSISSKGLALLALAGVGGAAAYFLWKRIKEANVDISLWPPAPNAAILRLAQAIAIAEGSPASWNNPGDLTEGDAYGYQLQRDGDGNLLVNSAGVVRFVNLADGVNALYRKLRRIQDGISSVYSRTLSLADFAQKYTGGDNADSWAANVASFLGLDPYQNTVGDALS
jgi:hypothetical protein